MLAFVGQWGWPGLLVIGVIALVLFGSRGQIPAFMRDIGRGINSFRTGLKEGGEQESDEAAAVEEKPGETVEVDAQATVKEPAQKSAKK